ncbi:MAG: DUF6662 family protein [Sphingomonas sp.]
MLRYLPEAALAVLAIARAGPAGAGGVDFGYSYAAETADVGETEVALWVTDRRGKGAGHYDAQDYRLEVERGITDRFQASIYADFASHHISGLEPRFADVRRNFAFRGLEAEFKYVVAKPTGGRIGFALYAEPGWSRIHKVEGEEATEVELELKAIVQKNFLNDRLVWVGNLTLEPEWEREAEELAPPLTRKHWEKELKVELTTGLAYRVTPHWSLGLEGRYHSVYPDWTHGLHREAFAVSAGPTVHYAAGEWGITATWLPQLFGGPSGIGSNLEFGEHEKNEFRVKLSREF